MNLPPPYLSRVEGPAPPPVYDIPPVLVVQPRFPRLHRLAARLIVRRPTAPASEPATDKRASLQQAAERPR